MAIRIRLARQLLTRNSPNYQVVATESTKRPTAKPLELLGTYSPLPRPVQPTPLSPNGQPRDAAVWGPAYSHREDQLQVGEKRVVWNQDRIRYWLSVGAKPSKTVERLLNQAGIIQSQPVQPIVSQGGRKSRKLVMSRDRRINEAVRLAERERGELPVAQRR